MINFKNNLEENEAQFGRLDDRLYIVNDKSNASLEIYDNGYVQVYTPSSFGIYIADNLYVNNLPVSVIHNEDTKPTTSLVGYCFFDTNLSKPIWWNGSGWVDATGTLV